MLSKFKFISLFLFTLSIVLNFGVLSFMNKSITSSSKINLSIYANETSASSKKNVNQQKQTSKKVKVRKCPYKYSHLPLRGQITSRFGRRWGRMHKGIDIVAKYGTVIRAFREGTVSFSGRKRGYGRLVIIKHKDNLSSYYGHNSENLVKKGDKVKRGQRIAKVGCSGNATAPHLHFEIRKNGVPVNPLLYLKDFKSVNK